MTFQELDTMISETNWFSRLSSPGVQGNYIQISTLAPWANIPTDDRNAEDIADQMEWLPSSKDQSDPIHGNELEKQAESLGKKADFSQQTLSLYKKTLSALRTFQGHSSLRVGSHDFTEAARGAALYAIRRAAYEILLNKPDFWCELMEVYRSGHWPCGILKNKRVVVI